MEGRTELTEREQLILKAVVHTYITSAEAVGSRSIVKRLGLDLSPATVRNVMADLEEAGYLQQLHTSSGRVPTDSGYRYYVDYLMGVQELTISERARIEQEFSERLNDADEIMRQTSHLLALISRHTGIVESPDETRATVRRLELVPLRANLAAVMVADNYGRVRTLTVTLPEQISDVAKLNRYLNEMLEGAAVEGMAASMQAKAQSAMDEYRALA
ncbi:MAG: heat-inducible transcription repressor HrcA [Candidatus Hydrogenedentes bacterium]|nr:heat-inducible transcription repressor HrcA [Candidatus Hydrogenedentota bacterium]